MALEAETAVLQLEAKEHQGRPVNIRGWREGLSPGAVRESTALPAPGFGICSQKAMAPHSSTLAWQISWTEEPGGLQSMGLLGVGHD